MKIIPQKRPLKKFVAPIELDSACVPSYGANKVVLDFEYRDGAGSVRGITIDMTYEEAVRMRDELNSALRGSREMQIADDEYLEEVMSERISKLTDFTVDLKSLPHSQVVLWREEIKGTMFKNCFGALYATMLVIKADEVLDIHLKTIKT